MKLSLLLISLMVGGCCSCGSDVATYTELPPIVKINERYIPIPEILIDGATAELTQESDSLYTFSDVFTDSTTGKKIEISGVIPKKKDKIHFSARVPKDSIKTADKETTIKQVPIQKEKGLMERFFENVYYVASFVLAIITLLIIYTVVKK